MKRCPQCRRDYYDETLLYCLDDGEHLVDGPSFDESATAILADGPSEARTKIISDEQTGKIDRQPAYSKNSLIFVAAGILLVALLAIGGFYYIDRSKGRTIDSIAVMPFVNESNNAEIEYLSDGIPESLISSLSQLPDLTVKPRSSVFRYKGKNPETRILGTELNVQAILTGAVVQRGSEISLHIELVDAISERVLWSKDYKRPLSNLLDLHTEIVHEVSSELKTKLSGVDERKLTKSYTANSEAYQLYLKGRYHYAKRTKNDLDKAVDYFRQAVAIDPNYALAYSGLADVFLILGGYDYSRPRLDFAAEGRSYALRALSLDGSLSQAHHSVGLLYQTVDHNFVGAEKEYRLAIELDPNNAAAWTSLGSLLTCLGRMSEAEASYRRALEIEPASANVNRGLGGFLLMSRRYEESAEQFRKTVDLEPGFIVGHLSLANAYMQQGKDSEAIESYIESRKLIGYDEAMLSSMRDGFAKGGWPAFVENLDKGSWPELYRPNYIKATQYVLIGQKEKALTALEKAYTERDGFIPFINVDPRFDALRDEPRFKEIVKKVGF